MDYTKNYNLKKPAAEDYYNIADFNENSDTIDEKLLMGDNALTLANQLLSRVKVLENNYSLLATKARILVTIYGPAGCNVSLTSGNSSCTATIGSSMEVTLTADNIGESRVKFTYMNASYTVKMQIDNTEHRFVAAPIPLSQASWAYIAKVSEHGLAQTCWKVGDTKKINVDGATADVHILGFEHDNLYTPAEAPLVTARHDFTKAGISFGLVDILPTMYPIHPNKDDAVNWGTCDLRLKTLPALLASMDEGLQAAIKTVRKVTALPGANHDYYDYAWAANGTAQVTDDKLFIFSERDLYGTHRCSSPYIWYETPAYDYYRQGGTVVRSDSFWLRNSNYNSSGGVNYTLYVLTDNTINNRVNTSLLGLLFGFCV